MLARRIVLAAALAAPVSAFASDEIAAPVLPPPLEGMAHVTFTRFDGASASLRDLLAPGVASIVSFWATWCPPCAVEARHLGRMRQRIAPSRLNMLGVNVDTRANEIEIARFLQAASARYTQVRGDIDAYRAFGGGGNIELPRLFVFTRDGRPLAAFDRYLGPATSRRIDDAVAAAMG
ncbi:MAG: TlpA family protein disulfide reductase [Hyphomonadaceae bacterium]